MNVLVLGGAGYIGSHVVYELIRDHHQVTVIDDLSTGNKNAIHPQAKLIIANQLNKKVLEQVFKTNKFDVVMHFSAKLIVSESIKKPIEYFENNVYGLMLILKMMCKYNVKNIVFSSTAAVYGNAQKEALLERDVNNEPISPYGSSKLACEWLLTSTAKAHNLNYVIFRYFNVAGADISGAIGQSTKGRKLTHIIPVIVETALGLRKEFSIYGTDYPTIDGTCIRDYIHVSDLALAHIKGAKYTLKNKSGIFNLGSKKGYSVKEVIETAQKVLNSKIPTKILPRREGDPAILIANSNKAKQELDFTPKYTLSEMISSDYTWRINKKF